MIVIFDLDDTLYDEITYVKSGFDAVAMYLEKTLNIDRHSLLKQMLLILKKKGRGDVFDELLKKNNKYSKKLVKKCLSVYRGHEPNIALNNDATQCLTRLKGNPKYIITDGNKFVQQKKVEALKISKYFKKIFITHRYGVKNSKPSPYCFVKISELEKKPFDQIVYIGDNPNKDFIEIKKLGFKTIQIQQGPYKNLKLTKQHEADIKINSLNEVTNGLFKEFK